MSLASRLARSLSAPDGQGWSEVSWVLPEARNPAHGRWMLRFLVAKK